MAQCFKALKLRLKVWRIWKKRDFGRTKWQKFCVLIGLRHSPSFEIDLAFAKRPAK